MIPSREHKAKDKMQSEPQCHLCIAGIVRAFQEGWEERKGGDGGGGEKV